MHEKERSGSYNVKQGVHEVIKKNDD